MTNRKPLIAFLVLGLGLAGCTTASLQDAAPTASDAGRSTDSPIGGGAMAGALPTPKPPQPPREAVTGDAALAIAAERPTGAVNTNAFPNLNQAPVRHESRISTEQEAEDMARLAQQRDALAAGAAGNNDAAAAEAARLRSLGASHADDAIRQIETP